MAKRNVGMIPFVIGWVLTGLIAAFMLLGVVMAFNMTPEMIENSKVMGWSPEISKKVAIINACCVVLFLIPQTAVLGGLLLVGYLGGATATHVRIGDAGWWVPVAVGVVAWISLYLRDARVRHLAPLRSV